MLADHGFAKQGQQWLHPKEALYLLEWEAYPLLLTEDADLSAVSGLQAPEEIGLCGSTVPTKLYPVPLPEAAKLGQQCPALGGWEWQKEEELQLSIH
ncbi:hypothetical protein MDA_GLEAN10002918 [Myotis davidii]|uniref:Uncharacterized protein n=1 Tax=Myotis davidii TaxID=225400 RepID=L5MDB6_MYODS|nr:hypothetical protein MDA_GLEAN10002918 [Myotis davidii]